MAGACRRCAATSLLLSLLLSACAGLGVYTEPPRVSLVSVEPLDMTLFEQRYRIGLRIQNPNQASLAIRGMDYEVELNGRKFAHGLSPQAVDVPAYGEQVVEVEVVSNLLRIVDQIHELESGRTRNLSWRLSGDLRLADRIATLPFDYAGQLDLSP